MKRSITLLIALALAIVLTVPALGEEKNDFAGFQPFEEPVKIKTVIGYSEADIPDAGVLLSTCEWNSMVKDYLNIEFDWMWEVPTSQYRTKLDLALSSGQYPDILKCDFETLNYLKEADMLADLSDVWEEYASEPLRAALDQYLYSTTDENGKLYAIPYANNVAGEMHVTFWRKGWLDNLGLDVPTNFEEYTAAIKAMRDGDPDGNGIKDTYGICFWSDLFASRFGMNSVFNAFGAYPGTWIERDGTIVRGDIQPEVKEALDYLRELYAGGYIPPEFATYSRDQAISQIVSGQIGQYGGKWFVPDYAVVIDNMKNDVNADWFCIAMPGMTDDAPRGDVRSPEDRQRLQRRAQDRVRGSQDRQDQAPQPLLRHQLLCRRGARRLRQHVLVQPRSRERGVSGAPFPPLRVVAAREHLEPGCEL